MGTRLAFTLGHQLLTGTQIPKPTFLACLAPWGVHFRRLHFAPLIVFSRRDCLVLVLLLAAVAVVWTTTYRRWSAPSWSVPVAYVGDAWFELTAIQGIAESGAGPFFQQHQPRLHQQQHPPR